MDDMGLSSIVISSIVNPLLVIIMDYLSIKISLMDYSRDVNAIVYGKKNVLVNTRFL